ncbi:YkvA family protein [Dictyobacter kobayashii]|uniref:Membrane protein n=1 Tax=Dictyobacter kobayashii TaxID=2014872 RepID=A0A402AY26_9CHLR|nr:DUF1232 domain-containing protein [Dictyobacter kobayashii]GCE24030.1 membrane protein [Dictyobacter kobayashii]
MPDVIEEKKTADRRFQDWKRRVRLLKREIYALYFAYKDPRVPWYSRLFTACVIGYALSPLDLIPDFIPVLGLVDDLLLLPLGIYLALKMIPEPVLLESRQRADILLAEGRPVNRVAAAVIIAIWLLCALLVSWLIYHFFFH